MIETPGHDSYLVKVDGSGRVTKRNRRFLRKFTLPSPIIQHPTPAMIPFDHPTPQPDITTYQQDITNAPRDVQLEPYDYDNTGLQEQATALQESEPVVEVDDSVDHLPQIDPPEDEASSPISISRHRRSAGKPRRYEPETGKWVEQS